jgi:hypothetical protein
MYFVKKSYDVFYGPQKIVLSLLSPSLCHTPSLFLNEIMKNQVLNKIVSSKMKTSTNAALMFSIYNKYKVGKIFLKYKHE